MGKIFYPSHSDTGRFWKWWDGDEKIKHLDKEVENFFLQQYINFSAYLK